MANPMKIDNNPDDFPEPCMEATGGNVAETTTGGDELTRRHGHTPAETLNREALELMWAHGKRGMSLADALDTLPTPQPVVVGGLRIISELQMYLHDAIDREVPESLRDTGHKMVDALSLPVPAPVSVPGAVKRYDMDVFSGDAAMLEDEFGQYVLYDDIAHPLTSTMDLGAVVEALEDLFIETMTGFQDNRIKPRDELALIHLWEQTTGKDYLERREALATLKAGRME